MTRNNDMVSRAEVIIHAAMCKMVPVERHPEDSAIVRKWAREAASDVIRALTAEAGDESGFGGETIGKQAIGHLREMYRPAFDALGPSGRVSLRNYIDSRVRCAHPATEGGAR